MNHFGDYGRAEELLLKGLELSRVGGNILVEKNVLVFLAGNSLARGDIDGAVAHFQESEAWFRQMQDRRGLASMLQWFGYVRHLQGDDGTAHALLREAVELQQLLQRTLGLAESLMVCACMSADWHQPQRAARLFGAAEHARERKGLASPPPGDMPIYDPHLERARADLDESVFDAAWMEGRAMTLEQAIEYALELPLTPEQGTLWSATRQAAKKEFYGLTEREREVAARIAQGESNREIAEVIVVSERTVETHVTNILNKLGFTSRAEIRKWAVEKGLVKRVE